ncbi:hypothetical protein ACS0TY_034261 [Phlomoides rotata]
MITRCLKYDMFYERNEGLLLEHHLSATQNSLERTKLFSSNELTRATDHYNKNRILGRGGLEVSRLVYEFIPNGTLFQHIHYLS